MVSTAVGALTAKGETLIGTDWESFSTEPARISGYFKFREETYCTDNEMTARVGDESNDADAGIDPAPVTAC